MNKVIAIGRLGREPEMKYSASGKAITTFSVATDIGYGDNKVTEWLNVVTWERLAESCAQYLAKGSQVYLEGELRTHSWDDKKSGEKKYRTEVTAREVKFLDSKRDREPVPAGGFADNEGDIDPDDLPFAHRQPGPWDEMPL